jgi:ubiquinone/menaquinone biosynthesis C-methylase UbiE
VELYDDAADWYDRLHGASRDYAGDADAIAQIARDRMPSASTLLDVGCGTGEHLKHLQKHFECSGVDAAPRMLEIAAGKLPAAVTLQQGDMTALDLDRRFDIITCLWSSIGYVETFDRLQQTAARMAAHLTDGGVLIVEPWLTDETFEEPGTVSVTVDEDERPVLTVIATTSRDGAVSRLRRLYVAATAEEIATVEEHHVMALFTREQYVDAFEDVGLQVTWDDDGLSDRGLIIGVSSPNG